MMDLHGLYAELQMSLRDGADGKETNGILAKIERKRNDILKGLGD